MVKPGLTPWLGAIVCSALLQSPADAGGLFGLFSRKKCESCPTCDQQCESCKPKKQHFKCFRPPEPPRAPVGLSFAADPQAQFADNSQDDRFDKLEKDVTRLTLIVKKLVDDQAGGGGGAAALPPRPNEATAEPASNPESPVPPGPIPASARVPARQKTPPVQQAVIERPDTATIR